MNTYCTSYVFIVFIHPIFIEQLYVPDIGDKVVNDTNTNPGLHDEV